MKYKKKPVAIDAVQWTGNNISELRELDGFTEVHARLGDKLIIHTLEGDHRADIGDYIIRGVRGEFYPCKKDIFEETYEPEDAGRGRWEKVSGYCTPGGDPVWRCSECGKGLHVYGVEHLSYGRDIADGQWVACPNCGADMREPPKEES